MYKLAAAGSPRRGGTAPARSSLFLRRIGRNVSARGRPRLSTCKRDSDSFRLLWTSRVRSLTPELAKGLEFDLVILIDPEAFGKRIEGAVDRYVAMTRATQQLVILTSS
jgi:superfamily I DNA/RNA helicase